MSAYEKVLDTTTGSIKDFFVLVRHFFLRLFQNDVVLFEEQKTQKIIVFLAFVAVFSAHLADGILRRYLFFADEGTSWVEKSYFLSYLMVLMGFITVLEWDVLFPDKRDFSNLMSLPIKMRAFFSAKFTSLILFVGMFSLGANVLSLLVFYIYLPRWQSPSPVYGLRFIGCHLLSAFCSCLFIVFFCTLLMGALINILGDRWFRSVSLYIRTGLMVILVFLMILFFSETLTVTHSLFSFLQLKESNASALYYYPPMWFTGLYESLLGNEDPLFSQLSNIALFALGVTIFAFFLTSAISYSRYLRRMDEVKKKNPQFVKMRRRLVVFFSPLYPRHPTEKAVFSFFRVTLRRSMIHKMRLASFTAIALGMISILLVSRASHTKAFSTFDKTLLSLPLILTFFFVVGIRRIVKIPSYLEANWIFHMTESKDKKFYFSGTRKGVIIHALIPLFLCIFIFYFFLWGWKDALYHCIFGLTVSVLLMEVLFIRFHKIPFTSSYLPVKEKLYLFWIVYLLGFILYVGSMSSIEILILAKPSRFIIFFGVIFLIVVLVRIYQYHIFYRKTELVYEEKLEPVMLGLDAPIE
jgi:hypothetical protein